MPWTESSATTFSLPTVPMRAITVAWRDWKKPGPCSAMCWGTPADETLIGGNASLTLMYNTIELALTEGLRGPASAWGNSDAVKFLCPTPGYDRHFALCEHLGIEMIAVPMLDSGPDMDTIEALVKQDSAIKGLWCVPRFFQPPPGAVYSDANGGNALPRLGLIASDHFLVMWDNAYAIHSLYDDAPELGLYPHLLPAAQHPE